MENRTEIGKIFKDKLVLLEKKPSDNLWASIENDLNKKRKRRVLFWLLPTLLSAVIATSFLFFEKTQQNRTNPIQVQEKQNTASKTNSSQNKGQHFNTKKNSKSQSGKSSRLNIAKVHGNNTQLVISQSKPTQTITIEPTKETKTTAKKSRTEKLIKQSSKLITSTEDYEEYEVVKKYKVIVKKDKTITTTYKTPNTKTTKKSTLNKAISSNKKKAPRSAKKLIRKAQKNSKTIISKPADLINNTPPLKEVIINEPLLDITKTDSINKNNSPKKPEKKQTQKREYVKKDYPQQKSETDPEYSVSVYYGPAIFGSLSNESTINKSFNDASKSHPITSHYGFYFKSMYGKYGFKVGVAKINLRISNQLNKQSVIRYENIKLNNYNSNDIDDIIKNNDQIKINQKISYYEMPLEFNFALKKDENPFGVEAFTGFSILILDDNQLYLTSSSIKNESIGKLKNLSETNLSFNLGLGFNYKLTEKFQLDFNPIFKYYLTTFNDKNSSKPYSLSIQSGVTYKF